MAGPVFFRVGYRSGRDLDELVFGTGLLMGQMTLDYAFGMVDEMNTRHRVSLAFRF